MAHSVRLLLDDRLVRTVSVGRPVRVGRDARRCDVVVDAPGVSGVHAELQAAPGGVAVRDLGAKNGVVVDGERVTEAELAPGQSARLGTLVAEVVAEAPTGPWPWAVARLGPMARGPVQRRLEALVEAVGQATGAPDVWAVRWDGERLEQLAAAGAADSVPSPGAISRSIVARVAASGSPWWADDAAVDTRWATTRSVAALRSVGCVPLGERGALFVSDPRGPGRFGAEARARTEALCAMAAQVIEVGGASGPAADGVEGVVGTGPQMEELLSRLVAFAPFPYPVLLLGERGTGKTHLAEALHRLSGRTGAFVHANAAAITETLAEDVLFGHDKGAFAGAETDKPGWAEQAADGTLFLDEIGDLPASVQPKLLVLLDRGTYQRVGSATTRRFTGRIVAATNRPVDRLGLRRDLYDRLSAVVLRVPPLRAHAHDVPALAEALRQRELDRLGLPGGPGFTEAALAHLAARPYTERNVRGLASDVQHALVLALTEGARRLEPRHLPAVEEVAVDGPGPVVVRDHATAMSDYERQLLEAALEAHGGNQTAARKALGLSHGAWYRAKKRVGLS